MVCEFVSLHYLENGGFHRIRLIKEVSRQVIAVSGSVKKTTFY